jgi:hypothetical protein
MILFDSSVKIRDRDVKEVERGSTTTELRIGLELELNSTHADHSF